MKLLNLMNASGDDSLLYIRSQLNISQIRAEETVGRSDHAARGRLVPREGELRAAEPQEQRRAAHRVAGRQDLVQQGGSAAEVLPAQAARGRPPHGAADRGHAGDARRQAGPGPGAEEPQEAARDPSTTRQGDGRCAPHSAQDGPRAGSQARLEAEGEEGGQRRRQAAGGAPAQDCRQDAAEAGGDRLVHLAGGQARTAPGCPGQREEQQTQQWQYEAEVNVQRRRKKKNIKHGAHSGRKIRGVETRKREDRWRPAAVRVRVCEGINTTRVASRVKPLQY